MDKVRKSSGANYDLGSNAGGYNSQASGIKQASKQLYLEKERETTLTKPLTFFQVNPTPHTPRPTPHTLDPTPHTLDPRPQTLDPDTPSSFCSLHRNPKSHPPHPARGTPRLWTPVAVLVAEP